MRPDNIAVLVILHFWSSKCMYTVIMIYNVSALPFEITV